ncbi:aspartate/glutamate racemase family protein (plasmid) [Comamonadaceae bacterium OTU4NAUVB1]|nr:aspartate/glutamate racemase family protein [Comamonadaceae bacterium OTU4NAUVB1]
MPRLLVLNPNTSAGVSALLATHVRAACGDRAIAVDVVTARLGAPYIACEASYAVAGHAVLDAWASAVRPPADPPGAVLLGCFGDPGLLALRQCATVPVVGLAEAAFDEAARHGRFAVVTGGAAWAPMLRRLAHALGHGETLAAIEIVAPTGAELAADPPMAARVLAQACARAARAEGVGAVIVGGAGLAGMAARLQGAAPVPLIDSVAAGARRALAVLEAAPSRAVSRCAVPWTGVSAELRDLGTG